MWGIWFLGYVGNNCSQCCAWCAWIKGVLLTLTLCYLVIMLWSWLFWCLYMHTCMYVMSDRVIMDHDCFTLMFRCMYVCMLLSDQIIIVLFYCLYVYMCMYAYHCLTRSWLFYSYVYVCVYPFIYVIVQLGCQGSFLWRNDCICRWMAWRGSWSYEKSSGKGNHDEYMRSISCGYELILC